MPIQFRCNQCAHTLSIGGHKAGSAIHCPICLAIVTVPAVAVAPRVEPQPPPRDSAAEPRQNRTPIVATVGGGLGVVLLAVLFAVVALPYDDKPPADDGRAQDFANLLAGGPSTKPAPNPVKAPPVKEKPAEQKPGDRIVVKARAEWTEDDLVKQLQQAPELTLDRTPARAESIAAIQAARLALAAGRKNADPTLEMLDRRPDLAGLPFRRSETCRRTPSSARHLERGSVALREILSRAAVSRALGMGSASVPPTEVSQLSALLLKDKEISSNWLRAEAVPALMQLLMAENVAIRGVLVDQLTRVKGKEASEAIAQFALFDLNPHIREQALTALASRPAEESSSVLLSGFAHPWPVVAEHAAKALVTLQRKETIPALRTILDRPDPQAPYEKAGTKNHYVKEMVRINHLMNCLLCHPPSLDASDRVRGGMPRTDRRTFIRADITYLKQDFSTTLPNANPGKWPAQERFDFVVRERRATQRDLQASAARKAAGPTEPGRSILFALRELTPK